MRFFSVFVSKSQTKLFQCLSDIFTCEIYHEINLCKIILNIFYESSTYNLRGKIESFNLSKTFTFEPFRLLFIYLQLKLDFYELLPLIDSTKYISSIGIIKLN